ncbi:hypothetical protein Pmani_015704 [Petrolisthes manimaculis]|uniref:Nuclear RNA export factor 1 n=1 Tax=Petrolisthes manimaculis TaxID=1843537 RepID=A0AAE1UBT8_9EUCA|nr:hypothetical protein Pmani_015704 [Petrolisthes manimaculis]
MSNNRGRHQQPRNFLIHAKSDGSRHYYEHDDRGSDRSGGGSGNPGGKGGYRKFRGGGGRGGRSNWDDERGSRYPDGHWRGGGGNNSGGSGYAGGGRRGGRDGSGRGHRGPQYKNNDVEMSGSNKNRYQDMYKHQGRRRDRGPRPPNMNNSLGWHKIIIREASDLNQQEVLEAIRELVREPFIPILYEVEGRSLVFYLEDNGSACQAITEISRRMTMPSGQRLSIYSNRSPPPNRHLTPPERNHVTQIMSQRYSVELKRLDLKNFHNDPTLVKEGIFCPLYRLPNMRIIMDIVVSNVPSVEEIDLSYNKLHTLEQLDRLASACSSLVRLSLKKNKLVNEMSLDKLNGLGIVELTLEGNPVCDKFRDSETYISAVRKRCPKVMFLDGQDLPKPIGFEVDDEVITLPTSIPQYYVQSSAKDLISVFLQQYYQIFDSNNRKPLDAAYTQHALFSLTCNFPETGPGAKYTGIYASENRNLRRVRCSDRRNKLMVQGRAAIASVLSSLPHTTHDAASFTIDVSVVEAQLMVAVVSGVFRQVADHSPPIRFFSRSLTIVPEGTGFCIANEQLYITSATVEQIKRAFKEPAIAPVPTSPTAAVESPASDTNAIRLKQEMIVKFTEASGMLPQYSELCLEGSGWDYQKAAEMFTKLKAENKIPPEYFPQNTST